jgi:V8-like Glu-specific endopeptidase
MMPSVSKSLAAMLLLTGCGAHGKDASQLAISHGHVVQAGATGPEAFATVGLEIVGRGTNGTCSGALLADDLVVTAAHCVIAGTRIFAHFDRDFGQEGTAVTAHAVNPAYDTRSPVGGLPLHDVAVLRLEEKVGGAHHALALIGADKLRAGQQVRLAGYGITDLGDDDRTLRYVDTTYVGPDEDGRLQIEDAQRRGACSGDSGGPLYAKSGDSWYLAGVLSGGPIPCRGINVYTPLAAHRDFLAKAVNALED